VDGASFQVPTAGLDPEPVPGERPENRLKIWPRGGSYFFPISFPRLWTKLQSVSHPCCGPGDFQVKWSSAIVFNSLQVEQRLTFGRQIALSPCPIAFRWFQAEFKNRARLVTAVPIMFRRLPSPQLIA
jgi:hypothetical protein